MTAFYPQPYSSWKSGQNQLFTCWGHCFPFFFFSFSSSPLLFYPVYVINPILNPSGEKICIRTCLCCKDTCKEAEYLISLMYWANDLYFSHSCKNVFAVRTVGIIELEKSFFRGERQQAASQPGYTLYPEGLGKQNSEVTCCKFGFKSIRRVNMKSATPLPLWQ